ncbi:MAG: hypothetical protein LBK73_13820, partial [Treponema sp.]|nr:hypothetical protein [Treponema sp.]
SLFQNSVSFRTGFRKSGLKPAFSIKSKVVVPKLKFWNNLMYVLNHVKLRVRAFQTAWKIEICSPALQRSVSRKPFRVFARIHFVSL